MSTGRLFLASVTTFVVVYVCTVSLSQTAGFSASKLPPILHRPRIILFGDSITERSFEADGGWGAALANQLSRKVDVINRGFGGYNTKWALELLPQIFPEGQCKDVKLVTVFFGANDASIPHRNSHVQHVSLKRYRSNLREIHAHLLAAGVEHILFIAPPPIHDEGRLRHLKSRFPTQKGPYELDRSYEMVGKYARACCEVAQQLQAPCLDLYTELQTQPSWDGLFEDGLHLSGKGNQALYAALMPLLESKFPHLRRSAMPDHFPWWDKIDPEDPAATFRQMYSIERGGA